MDLDNEDDNMFCVLSPLPLLKHLQKNYSGIKSFQVTGFYLGIANCPISFPSGQHTHKDFEFMMPINDNVFVKIDNQLILMEKQKMIPFNSGQYHGPGENASIINGFLCISCEKEYLEKICYSIFNKYEIWFENVCFNLPIEMRFLLSLFAEESLGKQTGYKFMLENFSNMILSYILRTAPSNMTSKPDKKFYDTRNIKKAIDFLKEYYNSEFSLNEVSQIAGLSPYHFIRVFKSQTRKTPYEFLMDIKIEKAKELLCMNYTNITEVGISCGFNNPSHFSYIFRKKTGISPSEYRRIVKLIDEDKRV